MDAGLSSPLPLPDRRDLEHFYNNCNSDHLPRWSVYLLADVSTEMVETFCRRVNDNFNDEIGETELFRLIASDATRGKSLREIVLYHIDRDREAYNRAKEEQPEDQNKQLDTIWEGCLVAAYPDIEKHGLILLYCDRNEDENMPADNPDSWRADWCRLKGDDLAQNIFSLALGDEYFPEIKHNHQHLKLDPSQDEEPRE